MTFFLEPQKEKGTEVLNAGVASYSPIVYWSKMKFLVEEVKLKLDHVVVFLDVSDAEDESKIYSLNDKGHIVYTEIKENQSIKRRTWERLKDNTIRVLRKRRRSKNGALHDGVTGPVKKTRHQAHRWCLPLARPNPG